MNQPHMNGAGAVYLYLNAFPIGPGAGDFLGAEAGFLEVSRCGIVPDEGASYLYLHE